MPLLSLAQTDEDRALKERLEEAVAKAAGADATVLASALETLRSSIQEVSHCPKRHYRRMCTVPGAAIHGLVV